MTNPTTHVQEIYECQTCGPVILDAHGNCIKCGSPQVISTHKLDVVSASGEALPKEQRMGELPNNISIKPTITLTEDELHAFVHQCVDNSHFHGTWYATVENYFNAKRKEQLNGTN